jgi:hypothetical protein
MACFGNARHTIEILQKVPVVPMIRAECRSPVSAPTQTEIFPIFGRGCNAVRLRLMPLPESGSVESNSRKLMPYISFLGIESNGISIFSGRPAKQRPRPNEWGCRMARQIP